MTNLLKYIFPIPASRAAAERAYLDGSASLYDLECREREIDQGKFAPESNRLFWPARCGDTTDKGRRFAG
jgi:hypothetical protein